MFRLMSILCFGSTTVPLSQKNSCRLGKSKDQTAGNAGIPVAAFLLTSIKNLRFLVLEIIRFSPWSSGGCYEKCNPSKIPFYHQYRLQVQYRSTL